MRQSLSSPLVVVDASVILKWQLNDEECVSQAISLRDDFYLRGTVRAIAPQLLAYELANGIVIAARKKRINPETAGEALNNLMILGVELRTIEPSLLLDVAFRYNLTAYDAAYVALAGSEKCELWTGDKILYQSVRKELLQVKWIGDYPQK
jgi:predicted nucleic acid-binding protein